MSKTAENTKTEWLTCVKILHLTMIIGFTARFALKSFIGLAIVEMVQDHHNLTNKPTLNYVNGTRLDWTNTQKQNFLGSFLWGTIVTKLLLARLSEKYGSKVVIGVGTAVGSILTILTPLACQTHFYVGVLMRILTGICLGGGMAITMPFAVKWIPPNDRTKYISSFGAGILGTFISMPLSGYLIANFGWPSVFYAHGLLSLVWTLCFYFLVYDSPNKHPRISYTEKSTIERKFLGCGNVDQTKQNSVPWKKLFTTVGVWALIVAYINASYIHYSLQLELSLFFKDVLKFNVKKNGILSSLPYLAAFIFTEITGYSCDKIIKRGKFKRLTVRKACVAIAFFAPTLLQLAIVFWGYNATISVTAFVLTRALSNCWMAGVLGNTLDIAPNFAATITGVSATISSISGILATQVTAYFTRYESTFECWQKVFAVNIAVCVFGGTYYLMFATDELQEWNSATIKGTDAKELRPLNRNEIIADNQEHTEKEVINCIKPENKYKNVE